MTTLILTAGHPFFRYARPRIIHLTLGPPPKDWREQGWTPEQMLARYGLDYRIGWLVKWRDFSSEMNDELFETQAEAIAFALTVNNPPMTIRDDDEWGGSIDLAEMDAYWRDLDNY